MNCTVHPDVAATSYCRTCGKAMCEKCSHSVRGVVYCEDCIATRLDDTMPSAPASGFVPGTAGAPVVVTSGGPARGWPACWPDSSPSASARFTTASTPRVWRTC